MQSPSYCASLAFASLKTYDLCGRSPQRSAARICIQDLESARLFHRERENETAKCPQFLVSLIFAFVRSSSFVYLRYKWRGEKTQKLGTPKIGDTWPFPRKSQPEVFQTEVFSWTSAWDVRSEMLVFFPGFGGPDRSFWREVRRDVRPKTSSLG